MIRMAFAATITTLALLALACDRGASEPTATTAGAPSAQRLENEALDLALARLPAGLALLENGEAIRLGPAPDAATPGGELRIEADAASDFGIDVVQLANDQQASFTSAPGGAFFGAQKLVTPLGEATYARGRFVADDGTEVEETRAFAVHPAANRLITVTYRYPAAEDSRERVAQVLEILGEIEALSAPAEATPAPAPEG